MVVLKLMLMVAVRMMMSDMELMHQMMIPLGLLMIAMVTNAYLEYDTDHERYV